MSRIVLSTSSSGLDTHTIPHNIRQIRLHLHINNVDFIDGVNIDNEMLNNLMAPRYASAVHTSPATKAEVAEMFENLLKEGYKEVFITTLSSVMSESYRIIKEVAEMFQGSLEIYMYDCKDLNACEAFLAIEAESMFSKGLPASSIFERLDTLRKNHHMLFAVDDLKYMIRNKKLSNAQGFIANLLSIKPVLEVNNNGEIVALNKIRKIDRAFNSIFETFKQNYDIENSFVYILSGGDSQLTNKFVNQAKKELNMKHIPIFSGSNISIANHGPAAVGICVFSGEMPYAGQFYHR